MIRRSANVDAGLVSSKRVTIRGGANRGHLHTPVAGRCCGRRIPAGAKRWSLSKERKIVERFEVRPIVHDAADVPVCIVDGAGPSGVRTSCSRKEGSRRLRSDSRQGNSEDRAATCTRRRACNTTPMTLWVNREVSTGWIGFDRVGKRGYVTLVGFGGGSRARSLRGE